MSNFQAVATILADLSHEEQVAVHEDIVRAIRAFNCKCSVEEFVLNEKTGKIVGAIVLPTGT